MKIFFTQLLVAVVLTATAVEAFVAPQSASFATRTVSGQSSLLLDGPQLHHGRSRTFLRTFFVFVIESDCIKLRAGLLEWI